MVAVTTYATLQQLKDAPGITGIEDDNTLNLLLSTASRVIDGYCNRLDYGFKALTTATPLQFVGSDDSYLEIIENVEVTKVEYRSSILSSWQELTLSKHLPISGSPIAPDYNSTPYNYLVKTDGNFIKLLADDNITPLPNYRITAKWGYSHMIPEQVTQATIVLASIWYKRGSTFWSDMLASQDLGGMVFYKSVIDPAVKMMLVSARMVKPTYG